MLRLSRLSSIVVVALILMLGVILWLPLGFLGSREAVGAPLFPVKEYAAIIKGRLSRDDTKTALPLYAPDRVLVRFKEGVPAKQSLQAHAAVGAQVLRTYRIVPGLELVRLPRGTSVSQALAAYRSDPRVLYAEPDYLVRVAGQVTARGATVSDTYFQEQWNLWHPDWGIGLPYDWPFEPGNLRERVVAVLDTGVDLTHPDLADRLWTNPYEIVDDGQDNDRNGVIDDVYGAVFLQYPGSQDPDPRDRTGEVQDDHGHGTHVAGIIAAAADNGEGIAGVAGRAPVKIMACKFMAQTGDGSAYGSVSDAVYAIEYVRKIKEKGVPVTVVNASWGGHFYSQSLRDAIEGLHAADILFVAAAGNNIDEYGEVHPEWSPNDLWRFYPASLSLPNVLSVAASAYGRALAEFSNWGPRTVHLAAPGDGILSTLPPSVPPGASYGYMKGTSMAAAHVSGVAALLASLWPEPEPEWWELRNALLSGAYSRIGLQGYTVTGGLLSAAGAVYAALHGGPELLAVLAPGPEVRTLLYAPVRLAALHVKGAESAGRVQMEVTTDDGSTAGQPQSFTLNDDGNPPDEVADDGLCQGVTTFEASGAYLLTFRDGVPTANGSSVAVHVYDTQPYVPLPVKGGASMWWRDLGNSATPLNLPKDDSWAEVTVPFAVYCFGQRYDVGTKLYISDNGLVSFGAKPPPGPEEAGWWAPDPLPTPRLPQPVVAALWEDFDPTVDGAIYYAILGQVPERELVIEWHGLHRYGEPEGPAFTFQVVLGEGRNDILLQYGEIGGPGPVGVQFSRDAASIFHGPPGEPPPVESGLAVRFMVPGDLNQDARQDGADLDKWARRYGSSDVEPWDPADLHPDGLVDLLDFAAAGFFWHQGFLGPVLQ
ncbi:MAG: S8 family serine peptidase [Desulfotomaculales bacterium]